MIVSDYDNACVQLKRNDVVIREFKFKDFVSAKQFKPVNDMRNKIRNMSKSDLKITDEEIEKSDISFYELLTQTAFVNPLKYDEAIDIMTTAEVGALAEETLIFLINWSSIESVKQYAKRLLEMKQKETLP